MRRAKLARLARRLRRTLLANPHWTGLPRCPRCAMLVAVADWSAREHCCRGCEQAQADASAWWDEAENAKPWLPEEED